MTLSAVRRPDAIYITDDHLAVEVTRGLARSGLDFRRGVSVLTHANAPCLQPTAVPTAYLGYDSVRIIRLGVTRIERLIRRERQVSENIIEAEFFRV
jgi:DNA-binding LacI/PurR family transcriptional regulator